MLFDQLPNIQGLIIDMDGVLWHDTIPIGDLASIFDRIDELGLQYILATNNATKTINEYIEKVAKFGVRLSYDKVINSAQATGIFLQSKYPLGADLYVIGQPSLKKTLESFGMKVCDTVNDNIEAVVVSLDFQLSYEKLKIASLLLQSGCDFIGTNSDPTLPTPEGFIPGSGTLIGALEIASGKKATMIGKPETLLYDMALKRLGTSPEETLAIGDRLETDIAGAQAAGIHTALVLSGASRIEDVKNYNPPPEIIAQDLSELVF
ncbi:MAG: HAD-IIA family hydrolase [Brevefilum sp.]|nr:HAD-IIA family hydrolase [Brevefilum sp.]MDT8381426.1 HAD-IIA family hydrolase [Brevefilum sp.]MDW7754306.1 HAD-IIA family hydrolase [Brevefilum sp.]